MFEILLEFDAAPKRLLLSVHNDLLESFVQKVIEKLVILAFPSDDDWRADADFRCRYTFRKLPFGGFFFMFSRFFNDAKHRFEDFFIRKFAYLTAAFQTMRAPYARIENA